MVAWLLMRRFGNAGQFNSGASKLVRSSVYRAMTYTPGWVLPEPRSRDFEVLVVERVEPSLPRL